MEVLATPASLGHALKHSGDRRPVDGEVSYPDITTGETNAPAVLGAEPGELESLEAGLPPQPNEVSAASAEMAAEPNGSEESHSVDGESADDLSFRGVDTEEYQLPERSVLRRSKPGPARTGKAGSRIGDLLVETLSHFGVEATVVGQVSGPRVTRYELRLAPGTKVSKVANLKDDLAYALATTEIRILAPIPGKQAVGVEVPNLTAQVVTLGDIADDVPGKASPLTVWLGKDISGASVTADLARMPHLLIAGTTGSGKSGCINTMLCSILLRSTPDEVRMILVDPKRVELGLYESIPHLLTPVVSNPKRAAVALLNVVEEMERRYERMSLAKARNLSELNRVLTRRGEETTPYLLVVIDELADLMMISPQDRRGRRHSSRTEVASGRDSPCACHAAALGRRDHRADQGERSIADRLRSLQPDRQPGDPRRSGCRKPPGSGRHALQATRDVARAARAGRVRDRGGDRDDRRAVPRPTPAGAGRVVARGAALDEASTDEDGDLDPDDDPLLDKAIGVVVQTQTASVSLIQRRLRVGYTRAGRLVDMLERRGIISGYEGSKPRRVLITESDLQRSRAAVGAPS